MARGLIAPLMQLLQSLSRVILCGVLALVLGACAAGPTAGLQSYQSPDGRFAFLYPTGWTEVQVSNGPRVVFHDLIHSCLLYTSPSPRDYAASRMPSSA